MVKEDIIPFDTNKIKGKLKLEIRDKDGNIKQEEVKENYINPIMLEAMNRFLTYRTVGWYRNQVESVGTYWQNYSDQLTNEYSVFQSKAILGMTLTNNDKIPNEGKDIYIEGEKIGYGLYGSQTETEKVGSYNIEESIHELDYHKFVFDFGTASANGEFQSIYMARNSFNATEDDLYKTFGFWEYGTTAYVIADRRYKVKVNDGLLYTVVNQNSNASIIIANFDDILNSMYEQWQNSEIEQVITVNGVGELNTTFRDYTFKDGKIYYTANYVVADTQKNGVRIFSAPISDISDTTFVGEIDGDDLVTKGFTANVTATRNLHYITYREETDTFLLASTSVTTYSIVEVDANTLEFVDMYLEGGPSIVTQSFINICKSDSNLISFNNQLWDLENNELVMQFDSRRESTLVELSDYYSLLVDYDTSGTNNSTRIGNITLAPSAQFFSRVRLDQPVIKTDEDVMKITYEYNLPQLSLGKMSSGIQQE